MTELKSWLRENQALAGFLVAQALAAAAVAVSIIAYSVKLEGRVTTLEVRGSPHLATIDNRLTVLESRTEGNKERIDSVVQIMTRELGKSVPK
jgi:hypothetical protein